MLLIQFRSPQRYFFKPQNMESFCRSSSRSDYTSGRQRWAEDLHTQRVCLPSELLGFL